MAKYVKITFSKVNISLNHTKRIFPEGHDPKKVEIIAYQDIPDIHNLTKNQCVGVVKDADLAGLIANDGIDEITRATAITLGDAWRIPVNIITDIDKIDTILTKVQNSQALSQEEIDSINPDNATAGRNKITFSDVLTVAETKKNG